MEFIKSESIPYNITDMAVDQINNKIILTGDKTLIYSDRIKQFPTKLSDSRTITYIKKGNQLFFTTSFLVTCRNGIVYECSSNSNTKFKKIFEKSRTEITTTLSSKLVYLEDNCLVLNKINENKSIKKNIDVNHVYFENKNTKNLFDFDKYGYSEYVYKIMISNDNIIFKIRKSQNIENVIKIYESENLNELFTISSSTNHIFSKIIGTYYYAINHLGEIEKWNILNGELYDMITYDGIEITYFDNYEDNIYIATSKGEFIKLDDKYKIIEKHKICNSRITKFIILNNQVTFLDINNKIYIYKL